MPDPEKSTRPVSPLFRESFIALFQRHDQEQALRVLGELFYQLALEGRGSYLMPKNGDPITHSDILAAAGDLRQAADQLRESAQGLVEAGNEDREVLRITVAIADASAAVQPIADQLDAALERFLAAPPAT